MRVEIKGVWCYTERPRATERKERTFRLAKAFLVLGCLRGPRWISM